MPTPPDEMGDAQMGDVAMDTNTDHPSTPETDSGAGKNGDMQTPEQPTHSPSVAESSFPTSESIAPLDPQDSPSLHPSRNPLDQSVPFESEAQLPSEQSAMGYSQVTSSVIPVDQTQSPTQGEAITSAPKEQSQKNTNAAPVNTEQKVSSQNIDGTEIHDVELTNPVGSRDSVDHEDYDPDEAMVTEPHRGRSQRSGSVEMFGSFYPAQKMGTGGNIQTSRRVFVPGARVKRSGSVEMFGFVYPEKKYEGSAEDLSEIDGPQGRSMRRFSIPHARTSRSGSVEMFGFKYPEKKAESEEDLGLRYQDGNVRRFSIPQARTSRSGSVEMFGFKYPEKKEEQEDQTDNSSMCQEGRGVRRFSIPQARTTRSGSVEMFGFQYPEGQDDEQGVRGQTRSPWARVKRSGSVEMFGFQYPFSKQKGNSGGRDRSDSDGSQKSDDGRSVPFARVKRSGSVEMFGSFYPDKKAEKHSEEESGRAQSKDQTLLGKVGTNQDLPTQSVHTERKRSSSFPMSPIVEADEGANLRYVPVARVKRTGSVQMFGSFYPSHNKGMGSSAEDTGNLKKYSVAQARVKRSGSMEMFGFRYPNDPEHITVNEEQRGSQERRFSIPQARTKRSGSVEMFGFKYPDKKEGETDDDILDTDYRKGSSARRFSIPQARTTRSGSVEMFGFRYPETNEKDLDKDGISDIDSQKSGSGRRFSIPQARTTRSGSIEMFGFRYPEKKERDSDEGSISDTDSQKSGSSRRFSIPQARTTRSGSVEMFGFQYPNKEIGKSSDVARGDSQRHPLYFPGVRVKRTGSIQMFGSYFPSDTIREIRAEQNKDEDNVDGDEARANFERINFYDSQPSHNVRRFSIPQARTTRSGSVEMFGFRYLEQKKEDEIGNSYERGSSVRRFSIPQARTSRSGSVEMFGFKYPEKKEEEDDGEEGNSKFQHGSGLRRFSIPQARTTRSGSVEMFGFKYPEGSDRDSVKQHMKSPWARVKRSGSVEMFGFQYPLHKRGEMLGNRDRSDSVSSQKSDSSDGRPMPLARFKRSGSVEMFGSFYPVRKTGKSAEVIGEESQHKDDEKEDEAKQAPLQPVSMNIGYSDNSLNDTEDTDLESSSLCKAPSSPCKAVLLESSEGISPEDAENVATRARTKRSASIDMFGAMYMDEENQENRQIVPQKFIVPGMRVKRSGSVEMFGFCYPPKKGDDTDGRRGSEGRRFSIPQARTTRSGSVEMFGFQYPERKMEEGEESSKDQRGTDARRFSIPQARTTRSGSVEMFGFQFPQKKEEEGSEDGNISETDSRRGSQVRRFSIPQARTTRSGSVEMFGFKYPKQTEGQDADAARVRRQIKSPWLRVKRSGSVELFGFTYAQRKHQMEESGEAKHEAESEPTLQAHSASPSMSKSEISAPPTEVEDLDAAAEQIIDSVIKHAQSQISNTQITEIEHLKPLGCPEVLLAEDSVSAPYVDTSLACKGSGSVTSASAAPASKDSGSVSSADFVMIQHEDIWKDLKKETSASENVQAKEKYSEGVGERKDDDGDGDQSNGDAGKQQSDGNVNSNHAATEDEMIEPAARIDVPTVSVTVQIRDADDKATASSKAAAEAEDKASALPAIVQKRVRAQGGADESKRRSLMLWVDADLVQTVRTDQGTKSPQHSPEDIPSDLKRLKKVIRKERWAVETEHDVRKEMWKQLCLKNSAGASVSHVYTEVEEGLFGKGVDSVDPSSITLPSFVDPDHPVASYALKSEGQACLNRLLCVVADTRPDILYCPLLAPLAGMLLHYMSPAETFDCLSALLGSTRYKYLEVSWVEHESFRMSFEKLAGRFASSAHKMFIKQGDIEEIYRDWIWWILEDLPFSHVIRVMDCYLSEGLKIFYRVGLAILMLYRKHRGTPEAPEAGVAASIREFVRSIPVSPNTLLSVGFQFRGLSRSVIGAYQTKHKQTLREDNSPYRANSRRSQDAITKIKHINSSIITHKQLHTIWSWVPSRFSIYEPSLVFTTQEHGFSLTTFYTRCEYCEPTILLIKTSDQEIFGAYLSSSWSTRNDGDHKGIYFGTGESFLFSLAPEEKKYPWVGISATEETKDDGTTDEEENKEEDKTGDGDGEEGSNSADSKKKKMSEMFMRASQNLIAIGGGDGDGILVEGDLTKGFSSHCLTFDNPGLAKERSYNCDVIEVITMEDGRNPINGVTA